jgi:hypothetical protein
VPVGQVLLTFFVLSRFALVVGACSPSAQSLNLIIASKGIIRFTVGQSN